MDIASLEWLGNNTIIGVNLAQLEVMDVPIGQRVEVETNHGTYVFNRLIGSKLVGTHSDHVWRVQVILNGQLMSTSPDDHNDTCVLPSSLEVGKMFRIEGETNNHTITRISVLP